MYEDSERPEKYDDAGNRVNSHKYDRRSGWTDLPFARHSFDVDSLARQATSWSAYASASWECRSGSCTTVQYQVRSDLGHSTHVTSSLYDEMLQELCTCGRACFAYMLQ